MSPLVQKKVLLSKLTLFIQRDLDRFFFFAAGNKEHGGQERAEDEPCVRHGAVC